LGRNRHSKTRGPGLGDGHVVEEELELGEEERDVLAAEDLGHEVPAGFEHVRRDVEGWNRKKTLRNKTFFRPTQNKFSDEIKNTHRIIF
jgi:hypothetical protein